MTNPSPPSLSPRQLKLLRRGGVALTIYTFAVLVIVPWGNVWAMLFVPFCPILIGLGGGMFGYGLAQLAKHSHVGARLIQGLSLSGFLFLIGIWVAFRLIMLDQTDPEVCLQRGRKWSLTIMWVGGAGMAIGIGLALWGWVLFFRHRRPVESVVGDSRAG